VNELKRLYRNILVAVGLIVLGVFLLLPYYWLFVASLKNINEVYHTPPTLWPAKPTLDNYVAALMGNPTVSGGYLSWPVIYRNSIFVSSTVAAIVVVFTLFAGFALGRMKFRGKGVFFSFILVSVMLPGATILIPVFTLINWLGLLNTLWSVVLLYPVLALPLCVLTSIGTFRGFPGELDDAARVDGCTYWQLMTKIIVPISKMLLASTFIFAFLIAWNEYTFALVMLIQTRVYTVPLGLANMVTAYDVYWNQMAAPGIIISAPLIFLFMFAQRYFVRGLMSGIIKG
jgi:ABC-type glycerol-3-phosphate transport system permease component